MIRDANQSDLPCLAAAMVRLQETHVLTFPEIYRRFDLGDALAHLSGLLPQPDAFVRVALHSGAVVGHAVFLIQSKPESMFTHSQQYGQISQVEVEPECRRKGFGRLLLEEFEKIAASHGLPRIVLDVWSFNDSAKSFYEALGYSEFGSKLLRSL